MANRRLEEIKLLALCMASDNRDAFSRLSKSISRA